MKTIRNIVCRANSRALVGLRLCRDPDWIDLNVQYCLDVPKEAAILGCFPGFTLPLAARYLSHREQRAKRAVKHLMPMFQERQKHVDDLGVGYANKANDCLQWLLDEGKEDDLSVLAERLLSICFAANISTVHGLSYYMVLSINMFHGQICTQALYRLVVNTQYIQPLREEVQAAIEKYGWKREALGKMCKLDSLLKETMRLEGVTPTINRKALKDITLFDGTYIPKGTLLSVSTAAVHRDGSVYRNPETFDPFRFSCTQASEECSARQQLTAVNDDWLAFGYGKHACPGRFFASTLMKTVLAHILLYYDVKLEGNSPSPQSICIATGIIADPT
ncbi:hypothetical protein ID866_11427, partial [Astraeus odoratus]